MKMQEINWIIIKGNADLQSNCIYFKSNVYSNTKIRCNKLFRGGKIKLKITFHLTVHPVDIDNKPMMAFIELNEESNNPKLYFGISSSGNFSISQDGTTGWKTLSATDSTSFNSNVINYDIMIEVMGAQAIIYVNGVLVCKTEQAKLSLSPVALSLEGKGDIKIENFCIEPEKLRAFVIMDFSDKFEYVYTEVIRPVCDELDIICYRADEYNYPGSIIKDILDSIRDSDIIIADITPDNANVYFEVGYAYALGKNPVLLMNKERERLPFDVSGFRVIMYNNTIKGAPYVKEQLNKYLKVLTKN